MERVDVVVVGGGPAGLAVAIGLRERGARVVLLERGRPPIDKPCGEGLMPGGIAALRALGVEVPIRAAFHGVRNLDRDWRGPFTFVGRFSAGRVGWGIRRTRLHEALVARAAAVGVDARYGLRAEGIAGDRVRTARGALRADWIVGADGLHSHVRRWAGIEAHLGPHRRYGVRRHFRIRPWDPLVEVHWGPGCEAYVTPVADDEIGVALLFGKPHRGRFEELLGHFPALQERLRGAAPISEAQGAGPLEQAVAAVTRGRVLLVGDASGYLDALTGEGLSLALAQAQALTAALAEGRPQAYAAAHRRIGRIPHGLMRMVLLLQRRPTLRHALFRILVRRPGLYGRFMGLEEGDLRGLPAGLLRELLGV